MNNYRINFPVSRFGIILGLFGLGKIWKLSNVFFSELIGEIITLFTLLVWAIFMIFFILKWITRYEEAMVELKHPIKNNYIGLPAVTMMLMAMVLYSYSQVVAHFLFILGMVVQSLYGVFFTEQIWKNSSQFNFITPSLYIPTVAGNFVTAMVSGFFHYTTLGYLFLGIGFFSWLSLESIIMNRLKKDKLPLEFKPTMGILMAPPAIACAAYLSLNDGEINHFVVFLLGYALFQFLVFLKILRSILKNEFDLSFWAFSFGLTTLTNITFQWAKNSEEIHTKYLAIILFIITNIILAYLIIKSFIFIRRNGI